MKPEKKTTRKKANPEQDSTFQKKKRTVSPVKGRTSEDEISSGAEPRTADAAPKRPRKRLDKVETESSGPEKVFVMRRPLSPEERKKMSNRRDTPVGKERKTYKERSAESNDSETRGFSKGGFNRKREDEGERRSGPRTGREKRPYGDKERTPRREGSERTPRRESGDRPFSRTGSERTPRREGSERTPRRESSDRPFSRTGSERTPRREGSERTPRRESGDRPFSRTGSERTPRREGSERTPRRESGDRPFSRTGSERTPRREGSERTPRREGGRTSAFTRRESGGEGSFDERKSGKSRSFSREDERDSSPFSKYKERPAKVKKNPMTRHEKPTPQNSPFTDGVPIRLNRYLSVAGISSRREADELIRSGRVTVNGEIVTEMGHKVTPGKDIVTYNKEEIQPQKLIYILLNKPKNTITTTEDPEGRLTVMDLIKDATRERVFPVGRLDRNTTGLLLLTNDGELAEKLTHPSHGIRKIYKVTLNKDVDEADIEKLKAGFDLDDGFIKADKAGYLDDGFANELGIEIHSGRNRVVRRMLGHLGYEVRSLDRVMFGPLTKKKLKRGWWRFLSPEEVGWLKML